VIFAFHGYPWLVQPLTYRRRNHDQLHVRGYKEKGTTTTPFDMVMLNDLDRYHLVMDVIDRVSGWGPGRPACARTWSMPGCGRGRGPGSTAKTCRRSRSGPGRSEHQAWRRSRPDNADAQNASRRLPIAPGSPAGR
jgi:hypothetical protein